MSGSRREMVRRDAARKGWVALGFGASTAALTALLFSVGAPVLGVIGLAAGGTVTALRTWQWLKFRGEWGLRF